MLDLLEIPLRQMGIGFGRLDGSLSQRNRDRVLTEFKTVPSVEVLLVSLKAGCLGLNLTTASLVYLMDPWWNPVRH